ncbi:MAG: hypothetical protein MUC62_04865 [Candidatus Thermoplasmatota archaeon]|jgi:hypothetical protein|nr:hypothetical protein [Candidatus Thermoplasmatota archaeon]
MDPPYLADDEEVDPAELDMNVEVKCPNCPRVFSGKRDRVEEELYFHLWKVHDKMALEYILANMYIPEELKERIFEEMGPDYVSWLVDTSGEIIE